MTDNRFVAKTDYMPMVLMLADPQPEVAVVSINNTLTAPVAGLLADGSSAVDREEGSSAASIGDASSLGGSARRSGREQKILCASCRLAVCGCAAPAPAAKKQKGKKKKKGPSHDADVPEAVPLPPENIIRAKVLDGDEVVIYCSQSSSLSPVLLQVPICTSCGSFEEQKELLGCSNCGLEYHRFCLDMKTKPLGYELGGWRCPSCKVCECCNSSAYENMILVCERCDMGFHTFCLNPPLPFIPLGDWLCPKHALCISCGSKTAGTNPHHSWHDNDTLCHVCWTRIRAKSQCPSCLKAYDNNEWDNSYMVGCDCGRWVHRGCDGITHALYEELQKPEYENEPFNCIVCRQEGKPQFKNRRLMELVAFEQEKREQEEADAAAAAAITATVPHSEGQSVDRGTFEDSGLVEPMNVEPISSDAHPGSSLLPSGSTEHLGLGGEVATDDVIPPLLLELIKCQFCHRPPSESLGRMVPVSRFLDSWVHTACATWCNSVSLRKSGAVAGLPEALQKASTVQCLLCGLAGAGTSCRQRGCGAAFHFPCAWESGIPMHRIGFFCSDHVNSKIPPPAYVEVGKSKSFVTLQSKAPLSTMQTRQVEQSWDDRIKAFIAKNPSSFLNQQYDAAQTTEMSRERQERDYAFKLLATAMADKVVMQRGALQVASFGSILPRVNFHSSRLLFAPGFRALRRFWSYNRLGEMAVYECSILQRDDGRPDFVVRALDDVDGALGGPVRGASPAEAWQAIVKRFPKNAVRGVGDMCWSEEMFGFTPWVVNAMEAMVGVNACVNYNFQFWPRLSGVALGGQVDHPLGCARAIPYNRSAVKEAGAYVYSRVSDVSGGVGMGKKAKATNSQQQAVVVSEEQQPEWRRFRQLELHPPQLVVHKSRIHGMGVYTLTPIKRNDMVIEYRGEIIRPIVADSRERDYIRRGIPVYLWRLDDDRIVDATLRGNMARFINHCHDPNCYVDIVEVRGDKKVMVQAKRDINAGEELSYDYCFEGENVECDCGSINCPGFMNLPPLIITGSTHE